MFVLNNIFKSNLFDNVYPDSTYKMKSILKSQLNLQTKEVEIESEDIMEMIGYPIESDEVKLIINSEYYNSNNHYKIRDYENNYTYYIKNEELHKVDGPAFISYYEDGTIFEEEYHLNGKLHRLDGPAFIIYNINGSIESETYFIQGERQREGNKPVYIGYFNGKVISESYCIDGIFYVQHY